MPITRVDYDEGSNKLEVHGIGGVGVEAVITISLTRLEDPCVKRVVDCIVRVLQYEAKIYQKWNSAENTK